MPDLVTRVVLCLLAADAAFVGTWAAAFPGSFFRSFPGLGRTWTAVDGPYNEHLVRDVGGLHLALLVMTVAAAVTLVPVLVRTLGAAWLVFAAPHLAYHAANTDLYGPLDAALSIAALVVGVLLPLALVLAPGRPRRTQPAMR